MYTLQNNIAQQCECTVVVLGSIPFHFVDINFSQFFSLYDSSSDNRPFYGYHKNEHKFLKIFLYNPAFIRRTANFLQNGAILGRIFQPHESHVPFILQFMIDFNLYGMSFLHVPAKMVQYRQQKRDESNDGNSLDSDDELLDRIDPTQVLDKKIERMSTSKQEIDIAGAFILNRLQVPISEKSEHANPGIAFIWSDERARRHKIIGEVSVCQRF